MMLKLRNEFGERVDTKIDPKKTYSITKEDMKEIIREQTYFALDQLPESLSEEEAFAIVEKHLEKVIAKMNPYIQTKDE